MNLCDLIGPRSIPVRVDHLGDVFAGRHWLVESGHGKVKSPPIFDLKVGHKGPCPFDNFVKDFNGNIVGRLTGPITDRTLERW